MVLGKTYDTIDKIANAVCANMGYTVEEVFCKSKKNEVLFIRYIIYLLASDTLFNGKGCLKISQWSGQHHATVLSAVKTARDLLKSKNEFSSEFYNTVCAITGDSAVFLKREREILVQRIKEIDTMLGD